MSTRRPLSRKAAIKQLGRKALPDNPAHPCRSRQDYEGLGKGGPWRGRRSRLSAGRSDKDIVKFWIKREKSAPSRAATLFLSVLLKILGRFLTDGDRGHDSSKPRFQAECVLFRVYDGLQATGPRATAARPMHAGFSARLRVGPPTRRTPLLPPSNTGRHPAQEGRLGGCLLACNPHTLVTHACLRLRVRKAPISGVPREQHEESPTLAKNSPLFPALSHRGPSALTSFSLKEISPKQTIRKSRWWFSKSAG